MIERREVMREIKFRGKRLDNGQWVYGFLFVNDTNQSFILPKSTLWRTESDGVKMRSLMSAHKVNPDTVGQYTGLKDKNGAEICEGDNVSIYRTRYTPVENVAITDMVQLPRWFFDADFKSCEVIGNIHDNPELLEGGR